MNAAGWFVVALDQFFTQPEGIFGVLHAPISPAASPQADVTVDKEADQPTIDAGDTAGYSLDIINSGAATATGLTLNDPLPAGAGKDINWQIDTTTGTPSDFQITGSVGNQSLVLKPGLTLAVGSLFSVHITGVTTLADAPSPTFVGTLVNTATVSAANEPAADQNQSSGPQTITIDAPHVQVTKVADPSAFAKVGFPAGFKITVNNAGSETATGVFLSDPLPAGAANDLTWQIVNPTQGDAINFEIVGTDPGQQTLEFSEAGRSLTPGQSLTVEITSSPPTLGDGFHDVINTATVTVGNEPGANLKATASVHVNGVIFFSPPDVVVFKTADNPFITPGQTAGFTVELENVGDLNATGITLTDLLPGGAGRDIEWTIDPTTGNPADFQITGPIGEQSLTLVPGVFLTGPLPGLQTDRTSVHITGVTSVADAPNVFQSSGGYTIETGQLDNTATVSAANESLGLQNQQASASISLLGQTPPGTPLPPSISPASQSGQPSGSSSPSSSSANATLISAIQQPVGPSPAPTLLPIPLNFLIQVNAGGFVPAAANPLYVPPQYNPSPGPTFTNPTAGLAPMPGDISGVVFLDRNGNGIREPGDSGIPGLTVFIDRHGDGLFHPDDPQATTNDKGEYVFHGLPLNRTYQVRPLTPQFMVQTYPQRTGAQIITLSDNHPAQTDVTFGTVPYRPVTQPIRPAANPEKETPTPPGKSGQGQQEESRLDRPATEELDSAFQSDAFWRAGAMPLALLIACSLGQRRERRRW